MLSLQVLWEPSHACPWCFVRVSIHFLLHSCDRISLDGKPLERISLFRSDGFPQQLIWSHHWVREWFGSLLPKLTVYWTTSKVGLHTKYRFHYRSHKVPISLPLTQSTDFITAHTNYRFHYRSHKLPISLPLKQSTDFITSHTNYRFHYRSHKVPISLSLTQSTDFIIAHTNYWFHYHSLSILYCTIGNTTNMYVSRSICVCVEGEGGREEKIQYAWRFCTFTKRRLCRP